RGALLLRAGDAVAVDQMRLHLDAVALFQMRREPLAAPLAYERRAHHGGGDRARITARLVGVTPHLGQPFGEALGRDPERPRAVPEPPRAPPRGLRASPDPQGRPTGLHGLRLDGDALEGVEAARERRARPGEERPQDAHPLVRPGTALPRVHAD